MAESADTLDVTGPVEHGAPGPGSTCTSGTTGPSSPAAGWWATTAPRSATAFKHGFAAAWSGERARESRAALLGDGPPDVCTGCALYHGVFW